MGTHSDVTRLAAGTIILTCLFGAVALGDNSEAQPPRLNVVHIFIDDMGYGDLSCFGNTVVDTPCIDALAEQGIRLTNFYVNSPICSPSRVAVTTGQYPGRWGVHSYLASRAANESRGMKHYLDPAAPSVARLFQAEGYATAHFGKWHMGGGRDVDDAPTPAAYGFDEHLVNFEGIGNRIEGPKYTWTEQYVDHSIDFIRRHKDDAFFLRLFPNDVHDVHIPIPDGEKKWAEVTDNPYEQLFFAVLEEMDRQIGRLLQEIDALGLTNRTLIFFTSDNGPTDWPRYYNEGWNPPGFTGPFYGRKWSLYEGGIRMPTIARLPGDIPEGAVNETSLMCGIDLPPTFCAMAGVPIPNTVRFDGHDMSAALRGEAAVRPSPIFWQYGDPHAKLMPGNPDFISPTLAVRDGDWKLLCNPDGTQARLFNLVDDPGETTNLLSDERDRAEQMHAKLKAWSNDIGYAFAVTGELTAPPAPIVLNIDGADVTMINHGVAVDAAVNRTLTLRFAGGDVCLDMPTNQRPMIAGRTVRATATIEPSAAGASGVIVAQGGNRTGYSLYLVEGRPAFSVCVNWQRTTIRGKGVLDAGPHRLSFVLRKNGHMTLLVDGETVAEGNASDAIKGQPGDKMQIGADLIQPAGEYDVPNGFHGTLHTIEIKTEE